MDSSSFFPLFYRLLFVFVVVVLFCPCDARRPRAFIHIGPHKTGSTTIQAALVKLVNRLPPGIETLQYKQKMIAPFAKAVMKNEAQHHHVIINEINKNQKKDRDIILSSEIFDKPKDKRATDKLAHIFKDYDVTIIAYLREPLAHLVSYWAQMICRRYDDATLPEYLNARLADLKMLSSFPPPSKASLQELRKNHKGEKDHYRKLLVGGNGWELFRTLDLYRYSFNVTTKKEKKKKKRGEEEEGGNKIVLIDFDGVIASGKTLAGVLLNDIVGLNNITIKDLHTNRKKNITALNIKLFYRKPLLRTISNLTLQESLLEEGRERQYCFDLVPSVHEMREKLLQKGALKACSEVIDLDKTKRELDDYFSKKLEESGFEVLYGVKNKEWRGFQDCYVVDEEVGKTIEWEFPKK